VPDAFARANSIMMSGRQGPIYMCYDWGLRTRSSITRCRCPRTERPVPAPDAAALAKAADVVVAAERPVIIADFAATPPHSWEQVIAIAETLDASVWDCNSRLNFPSDHPLKPSDRDPLDLIEAELIPPALAHQARNSSAARP